MESRPPWAFTTYLTAWLPTKCHWGCQGGLEPKGSNSGFLLAEVSALPGYLSLLSLPQPHKQLQACPPFLPPASPDRLSSCATVQQTAGDSKVWLKLEILKALAWSFEGFQGHKDGPFVREEGWFFCVLFFPVSLFTPPSSLPAFLSGVRRKVTSSMMTPRKETRRCIA